MSRTSRWLQVGSLNCLLSNKYYGSVLIFSAQQINLIKVNSNSTAFLMHYLIYFSIPIILTNK